MTWKEHIPRGDKVLVLESHVDAANEGGIARFINHSCEPNLHLFIERVQVRKLTDIN